MKFLTLLAILATTNTYAILGTYELNVKIGEKDYKEFLIIEEKVPLYGVYERITGTYVLPGVFEVPFLGSFCSSCKNAISLSFIADENGNDFKVQFKGEIFEETKIKGNLSHEGKVFGVVSGALKKESL